MRARMSRGQVPPFAFGLILVIPALIGAQSACAQPDLSRAPPSVVPAPPAPPPSPDSPEARKAIEAARVCVEEPARAGFATRSDADAATKTVEPVRSGTSKRARSVVISYV